jgi:hypothetical protein
LDRVDSTSFSLVKVDVGSLRFPVKASRGDRWVTMRWAQRALGV